MVPESRFSVIGTINMRCFLLRNGPKVVLRPDWDHKAIYIRRNLWPQLYVSGNLGPRALIISGIMVAAFSPENSN